MGKKKKNPVFQIPISSILEILIILIFTLFFLRFYFFILILIKIKIQIYLNILFREAAKNITSRAFGQLTLKNLLIL